MRILLILLIVILALVVLPGIFSGSQESTTNNVQELIQYEVSYKQLSNLKKPLLNAYNSAKVYDRFQPIIFNGTQIKLSDYSLSKEATVGDYTYKAYIGRYENGSVKKTGEASILVLKLSYSPTSERGIEPPVVKVGSPLLSLLLLGNVSKDVSLQTISPILLLESGRYVLPRKIIFDTPCHYNTAKEKEKRTATCMFVIPSNDRPKEIMLAAYPSDEDLISRLVFAYMGYPVARWDLR